MCSKNCNSCGKTDCSAHPRFEEQEFVFKLDDGRTLVVTFKK